MPLPGYGPSQHYKKETAKVGLPENSSGFAGASSMGRMVSSLLPNIVYLSSGELSRKK
jgi:hypothetical protein